MTTEVAPGVAGPDIGPEESLLMQRVIQEALGKDRRLYDALSLHERKLVADWMAEAIISGNVHTALRETLWEMDYIREPVSPDEFLTSEDYMGGVLDTLYPVWREVLGKVLNPNAQIVEFILTGATGTGKTSATNAALSYKIYQLSCLRNAAKYYGLSSKSKIVFGFYALTKTQAADVGYYQLRSYLENSPYFKNYFPFDPKLKTKTRFLLQPIEVIYGSRAMHSLGANLLGFVVDEANFFADVKRDNPAQPVGNLAKELYDSATSRLYSRFMRPGGVLPGLVCLPSSRNAQSSFLEEAIAKKKENPNVYVADYAQWEVRPPERYWLPKFKVQVGDRSAPTKVLNNPDAFEVIHRYKTQQINEQAARRQGALVDWSKEEQPMPGMRVQEVPGEYLERFLEDPDQALRDIAGVATFNVSPLIRDRRSITDAIRPDLSHPFTVQSVTLGLKDHFLLNEVFDFRRVCKVVNSRWVPRFDPHAPRYIHVDLSKNGDATGIGMVHASHSVRINQEMPDGRVNRIKYPYVVLDFAIRVLAPKGDEIDHGKIRSFILFLRDLYPIKSVTYDGWQSVSAIQTLRTEKFNARVLSVDTSDEPYLALRAALFERRFGIYDSQDLIDELVDLQRDIATQKVDHPAKATKGGPGRKDVADGVCGAFFDCMEDEDALHHEIVEEHGGTWGVVEAPERWPYHTTPRGTRDVPLPMPQAPLVSGAYELPTPGLPGKTRPSKVAGVDRSTLATGLD